MPVKFRSIITIEKYTTGKKLCQVIVIDKYTYHALDSPNVDIFHSPGHRYGGDREIKVLAMVPKTNFTSLIVFEHYYESREGLNRPLYLLFYHLLGLDRS